MFIDTLRCANAAISNHFCNVKQSLKPHRIQGTSLRFGLNLWVPDFLLAPETHTYKEIDILSCCCLFFSCSTLGVCTLFICALFESCCRLPNFLDTNQYGLVHTI